MNALTVFKVFSACLILHFFADFTLQGILANLKCREWWDKNYPDPLYQHDHICSLIVHGLYWVLVTSIPVVLLWRGSITPLVFTLAVQAALHAWIDHAKANVRRLSLTADQVLHLCQIVVLVSVWYGSVVGTI